MGTIVTTEDVKEEGPHGDGNAAISGESGAGEFGPGESGGEHGKAM